MADEQPVTIPRSLYEDLLDYLDEQAFITPRERVHDLETRLKAATDEEVRD